RESAAAAACTSLEKVSAAGLFGLTRRAMTLVVGTNSCNNSSFLDATCTFNWLAPVRLPPGLLRLLTRPSRTGSPSGEDNRDCCGRRLCGQCRSSAAPDNHNYMMTNKIGCQFWEPIVLTLSPTVFDRNVLPFDEAAFLETLEECSHVSRVPLRRCATKPSDHGHRRLLRAGRDWPSR